MQWNKYPLRYATWIFIPLWRPPVCPSYPSNICGASLPEAFRQWTSISGGYSNSSCSSTRSLFSAVLSCNPYFFCRGCKTARSLYHSAFRSVRYSDGSRRKKLPLHSRNPSILEPLVFLVQPLCPASQRPDLLRQAHCYSVRFTRTIIAHELRQFIKKQR